MATHYDAIVIGTGQSGPSMAARLSGEGLKTAIIERKSFGGTCVNSGCTPTKALVASARAAYVARRADHFGVEIPGPVTVDMKKVKARKDEIVRASSRGVEGWLRGLENCTVFQGTARFAGEKKVEVDGETLSADKIFINVGARPFIPPIEGLEGVPYLTSSTVMELDELPEHLIILGASYIGLEFAQMYRRFGSRVTVIDRNSRVISRDDEDVSLEVQKILEREGVEFRLDAECMSVRPHADGVAMNVACDGDQEVSGSHLLLAVGRVPNTDDLGLDTTSIETTDRGFIVVDDQLRTSVEGVWATGDVNGQGAFTHTSYNDYEIVAANLFDNDPRRVSDRILCYGLFVDPPLGRVGMTEAQVRASGRKALIGKMPMTRVGRAKERSETQGFMKVLVDAETHRFLGAAFLCIGGDEIAHSILDAMYADQPYTTISRAVHIHPTVSELVPTMLQGLRPFE